MSVVIIFIICIAVSVLTYKKISSFYKRKGRGKFSTITVSTTISFIVFVISIGIGSGIASQDEATSNNTGVSHLDNVKKIESNVYTCNKFDSITQTKQGTKYKNGFYLDGDVKTTIKYTITDDELRVKLFVPGIEDSTEAARFNNISADGSRKYGNSSSNYFVSVLNNSTIKVTVVDFNHNGTITQICSK